MICHVTVIVMEHYVQRPTISVSSVSMSVKEYLHETQRLNTVHMWLVGQVPAQGVVNVATRWLHAAHPALAGQRHELVRGVGVCLHCQ